MSKELEGTVYEGPASKFDDSRFINASTLLGVGTIELEIEQPFYLKAGFQFQNQQSLKDDTLCLRFAGKSKVLKLNKTNLRVCQKILGPMCKDWAGKRIRIFTDPNVRFAGKAVGGVVIKEEVVPVQAA